MSNAPFKRLLAKRFPWARRALHAIDGRGLERLEGEFKALARSIETRAADPTLIARAIEEMSRPGRRAEFAWISPAPYDETGIAHFTAELVRAAPVPVDYFAPARDTGMALAWSQRFAEEGPHRLFPLDLAGYAAVMHPYRAILVSVGNSDHNLASLLALEQLDRFGPGCPIWLMVHDPLALNMVWRIANEDPRVFASMLRSAYGPEAVPERALAHCDAPDLIARGVLGLRALLRARPVERILVNSISAAGLVAKDLQGLPAAERIVVGFHPIFPSKSAHVPRKSGPGLRVGSFGVPGIAKRTEAIYEACAVLRKAGEAVELVLAGYGVDRYMASGAIPGALWVSAFDAPGNAALEDLMASVDVAVQLRRVPLGESSGVMAQLAAVGTPIVAADIGAFRDYAAAAMLVAPDVSAARLAERIRLQASAPIADAAALRRLRSGEAWWRLALDTKQSTGSAAALEPRLVRSRA